MLEHRGAPGSQEWDLGRHRIPTRQCRCCLEVMSRTLRNHELRLRSVRSWQWFLLLTTTRIPRRRRLASPRHEAHPRPGCHGQHCVGTSPARMGHCSWERWLSCIPDDGARNSHGQRPRPCSEEEQYLAFLVAFFRAACSGSPSDAGPCAVQAPAGCPFPGSATCARSDRMGKGSRPCSFSSRFLVQFVERQPTNHFPG